MPWTLYILTYALHHYFVFPWQHRPEGSPNDRRCYYGLKIHEDVRWLSRSPLSRYKHDNGSGSARVIAMLGGRLILTYGDDPRVLELQFE
jgi:hypothetical protein